jgi:hypothetical protein
MTVDTRQTGHNRHDMTGKTRQTRHNRHDITGKTRQTRHNRQHTIDNRYHITDSKEPDNRHERHKHIIRINRKQRCGM